MKKVLILSILVLILSINTGCDITNAQTVEPLPRVVIITPRDNFDDSFDQLAYEGILKAAQDYEFEAVLRETGSYELYIETVSEAARDADLVIALGHIEKGTLLEIAKREADTLFATIGTPGVTDDNIMSISFKDEEGAFLVGAISALTTEAGKIGFVGGTRDDSVAALEYGFRTGALVANSDVEVLGVYTGTFDSEDAGISAAAYLLEEGVDVIFHGAGQCGGGVIETAAEAGAWTINADFNMQPEDSQSILCSLFKRIDSGVYFSIQSFMEGKFIGGTYEFGLDFEAVGYTDKGGNIPKEIKKEANGLASEILFGNLAVPKNRNEFRELLKSV